MDENLTDKDKARMQAALGTLIASSMKQEFKDKDHTKLNKALDRVNAISQSSCAARRAGSRRIARRRSLKLRRVQVRLPAPARRRKSRTSASIYPTSRTRRKEPFERWLETRIKDKIGEDGTKSKLFLETLRSNIPTMMLFCVPLFAFVLKLLYFRQRRFYVEHLVYALHIHTFAYVGVVVIVLLAMAAGTWSARVSRADHRPALPRAFCAGLPVDPARLSPGLVLHRLQVSASAASPT